MVDTILKLVGMGVPSYSARGLTQTLEPIGGAIQLRRTINGALKDISDPVFRKYQSTISATDQRPPAIDLVWPGKLLEVWCVQELAVQGSISETTTEPLTTTDPEGIAGLFGRPYVPDSIRHEGGFTFYRPVLTMLVTGLSTSTDEWAASDDWSITLEEV